MNDSSNEFVARVSAEFKGAYRLITANSEIPATITGRLMHDARSRLDLPCVGDNVRAAAFSGTTLIQEILPRKSQIVRRSPTGEEQPLAANVDYLFIVSGLDGDFNPRRIERYIALAHASSVTPVIVLNKTDACDDANQKAQLIANCASGIAIHPMSAMLQIGLESLAAYVFPVATVAMAGSSGAGKSTLANALAGCERQATGATRADDSRGRHTTTHRQLIALPNGAFLIDTPGLRELQLSDASEGIESAFSDIEALAAACRFNDCSHDREPGCAVRAALGVTLDERRFENYLKLQREEAYYERRGDRGAEAAERERWKAIHRDAEAHMRFRRKQR